MYKKIIIKYNWSRWKSTFFEGDKLKKTIIISLITLTIFLIYLCNIDKKVYYLVLGDSFAKGEGSNGKIVKGYGGTTKFGCGDKIIRQDLAIMLTNYAKFKGKYVEPTGTLDKFADKNMVSD